MQVEFLAEGMLGWVKARSIHFLQRIMFLLIITRQAKIDTPLTIVNQDSIQRLVVTWLHSLISNVLDDLSFLFRVC